jgi:hypothetical protein
MVRKAFNKIASVDRTGTLDTASLVLFGLHFNLFLDEQESLQSVIIETFVVVP